MKGFCSFIVFSFYEFLCEVTWEESLFMEFKWVTLFQKMNWLFAERRIFHTRYTQDVRYKFLQKLMLRVTRQ